MHLQYLEQLKVCIQLAMYRYAPTSASPFAVVLVSLSSKSCTHVVLSVVKKVNGSFNVSTTIESPTARYSAMKQQTLVICKHANVLGIVHMAVCFTPSFPWNKNNVGQSGSDKSLNNIASQDSTQLQSLYHYQLYNNVVTKYISLQFSFCYPHCVFISVNYKLSLDMTE